MRIAVLLRDRCQPKKCSLECIKYCPMVRTGKDAIVIEEKGKPMISEELCAGCGICVHKCPFEAIKIIGLVEELKEDLVHQYGKNGFRLFRLPHPVIGETVGLLGPNAIGKTTIINILSGILIPNFGKIDEKPSWDECIEKFRGTAHYEHFKKLSEEKMRMSVKPQYVDRLPYIYKGKVGELLKKVDERCALDEVLDELAIHTYIHRDIRILSGGELQRVAIAAASLKDADMYFFDEPSSYLDIKERLRVAVFMKKMSEKKPVIVVEHDLAIFDFLTDKVYILYGSSGAYGIVSNVRTVRNAVNVYLQGYLPEENIKFRDREIKFEARPPRESELGEALIVFPRLTKKLGEFELVTEPGTLHVGEVVGVVGPNATGKTTFVKLLSGELKPDTGYIDVDVKVSYKPQYITIDFEGAVGEYLSYSLGKVLSESFYKAEIQPPLKLKNIWYKDISQLSGGEKQRVAIAECLMNMDADIFLLDEPSAYLDSNQRMEVAKMIRRVMEKLGKSALVVDHDVYMIDLISDSIMVFSGEPGKKGISKGPLSIRDGMNAFLEDIGITFRRDVETKRPRINKINSAIDREQKRVGEYYYER